MKVPCTITHEETFENGGFKIYEAGQFYEKDNPDPKYFDISKETDSCNSRLGRFAVKTDSGNLDTKELEDLMTEKETPSEAKRKENKNKYKGGYER